MSTCKYLKQKLDRTLYCKKLDKAITFNMCSNCIYKEYKINKTTKALKKANFGLIDKQNKRFSIIYRDLSKCAKCGTKNNVELNEVYEGAKRQVSMVNGFVVPLCKTHHKMFHNDREFALVYKKLFQLQYEKEHTRDEFLKLIHHNYL